jgi:tetratricopeptide (TPR) repeat protein
MTRVKALIATGLAVTMFATGAILLGAGESGSTTSDGRKPSSHQLVETEILSGADVDAVIAALQERLRSDDRNPLHLAELAAAYLQKARSTADPRYYVLADKALTRSLHVDPDNLFALLGSGELALARHDFLGALRWAQKALEVSRVNSTAMGVLGDAHIGLGNYRAAFRAYQQMVDIRPDLASFARVSYARELTGDVTGAAGVMRRAAVAGALIPENQAWVDNQLGDLHFASGALARAARQYRRALRVSPEFTPALAGLARVDVARSDLRRGQKRYGRVIARMPLPQYVIALGEAFEAGGQSRQARRQYELVRAQSRLFNANAVLPDVEMTLFFADHGKNPARALALARSQYRERPSIQVADALAWALYRNGKFDAARSMAQEALRLGTQDALAHFHAGMIGIASGDDAWGRRHLAAALDINGHFSPLFAPRARRVLAQPGETL